jgi:UDP-GlcNAc:undecaprenyl-phosphate GlcNAc-1-phosphate transferase
MASISSLLWFVLPALLSAFLVLALIGPARHVGLVDHPVGRKNHSVPTPLVGGLAIFLALGLTHWLAGDIVSQSASLVIALLVTVGIGVADDAHEIGHRSKFFAQLIAALVIVSGTEIQVTHLGDIFALGDVVLEKWSYLVTVIAIIGLMNAINMIDGLDGLAGTQVLIPLLMFMGVAYAAGDVASARELMILAGAISGFLLFNLRAPWLKRALVFMGDTGGLLLGLLLAWYSIRLAGKDVSPLRPITAVWILAVPLLDMGSVMFLRMIQRKSPFSADRQHLHYPA